MKNLHAPYNMFGTRCRIMVAVGYDCACSLRSSISDFSKLGGSGVCIVESGECKSLEGARSITVDHYLGRRLVVM